MQTSAPLYDMETVLAFQQQQLQHHNMMSFQGAIPLNLSFYHGQAPPSMLPPGLNLIYIQPPQGTYLSAAPMMMGLTQAAPLPPYNLAPLLPMHSMEPPTAPNTARPVTASQPRPLAKVEVASGAKKKREKKEKRASVATSNGPPRPQSRAKALGLGASVGGAAFKRCGRKPADLSPEQIEEVYGPNPTLERLCTNCGLTDRDTPQWRKGPDGTACLCNCCGKSFCLKDILLIHLNRRFNSFLNFVF